jgi:hypothetical protein
MTRKLLPVFIVGVVTAVMVLLVEAWLRNRGVKNTILSSLTMVLPATIVACIAWKTEQSPELAWLRVLLFALAFLAILLGFFTLVDTAV